MFPFFVKKKKKKNIIKERDFLKNQNISFIVKESDKITTNDIDLFYECYSNTIKKNGQCITLIFFF